MKNVSPRPAVALGLLALAAPAQAAWPSDQPIEVVVGFAPGGTTDVMIRQLAPHIARQLGDGASLVIVNKPGASGELAVTQTMRAKPDGYTLGIVNLPGYFFVPMMRKAAYATKDLTLVARIVSDPTVMVSRKDGKLADLKAIVAQLKAESARRCRPATTAWAPTATWRWCAWRRRPTSS